MAESAKPTKSGKPRKKRVDQQYKRIQALTEEQRMALHTMYYEGRPVSKIIEAFQQDMGLWKDVAYKSLEQYLYRYKYDVIEKKLVALPPKTGLHDNPTFMELEKLTQEIDVAAELGKLVVQQRGRVHKMLLREKDMPMLFNSLGGEMRTLAGFIKDFAELGFELGVLKRAPTITKISQDGQETVVESDGKEAVAISIANQQKLEQAAKAFFDVLDASMVDADGPESTPATD